MTTKDDFLFLQGRSFVKNNSSFSPQFSNLNLNHNNQNQETSSIQFYSKQNIDKQLAILKPTDSLATVDTEVKLQTFDRSSKFSSKTCNYFAIEEEKESEKQWKNDTSNSNKSTLSLHISAYENSVEASAAAADTDSYGNENENKGLKNKKYKPSFAKHLIAASSSALNVFEIPRQQDDSTITTPEIGQFKASQRLFNVNESRLSNQEEEEAFPSSSATRMPLESNYISETQSHNTQMSTTKRNEHPSFVDNPSKPPYKFVSHIKERHNSSIFDIQFCTFFNENIFATASEKQITVYQCLEEGKQILPRAVFKSDTDEHFYAINWVNDNSKTENFIVVGNNKGVIRTLDPFKATNREACKLYGHTDAINQIAVHPKFSSIFASASADSTIQLWHCLCDTPLAILFEHYEQVLSVSFHHTGEYLISGSMDHTVRIWDIYADEDLTSKIQDAKNGVFKKNEIIPLYYCDAETKGIHVDFIDCVEFIGDYILSKSCESFIALWKFAKFNEPSPYDYAYIPESSPPSTYTSSLAKLSIPDCSSWFIRFGVTNGIGYGQSWIACGNDKKVISIWDLRAHPIPSKSHYQITDEKFPQSITKVSFNRDGTIMIAVGSGGMICRCDKEPGFSRAQA